MRRDSFVEVSFDVLRRNGFGGPTFEPAEHPIHPLLVVRVRRLVSFRVCEGVFGNLLKRYRRLAEVLRQLPALQRLRLAQPVHGDGRALRSSLLSTEPPICIDVANPPFTRAFDLLVDPALFHCEPSFLMKSSS